MKELLIGTKYTAAAVVDKSKLASTMGSGQLDVLATPAVAALMEQAACMLVQPYLEEGITTVGTSLSLTHSRATPEGARITAEAELTAIEGRKYVFHIIALDDKGIIAQCDHERFSVAIERFLAKTYHQD